jgi:hypothetical protein
MWKITLYGCILVYAKFQGIFFTKIKFFSPFITFNVCDAQLQV